MILSSPVELPVNDAVDSLNVHEFLFAPAPKGPKVPLDSVVHIDASTGRQTTRGEFIRLIRRTATAFAADILQGGLGITSNERVGILSENGEDFSLIVHALLYIAVPVVLFNSHSTTTELAHAIKLTRPTRTFTSPTLHEYALAALKTTNTSARVCSTSHLHAIRQQTQRLPDEPMRPVTPDTIAYLILSSGTSGLSKAIMVSHRTIIVSRRQSMTYAVAFAKANPQAMAVPHPRILGVLPCYHTFGYHTNIIRAHTLPTTVIWLPRWSVSQSIDAIVRYKITHLTLVPSMIQQLVHSPLLNDPSDPKVQERREGFKSIVGLGSAAAYLPTELGRQFSELVQSDHAHSIPSSSTPAQDRKSTIAPTQGYGLSEVTITGLLPPIRPPTSVPTGQTVMAAMILVPGGEALLLNDFGKSVGVAEPGELWLRGPNIAMGYWENEVATRETFNLKVEGYGNGWLRTGDRFCVDNDGYFYFIDRIKDVLKVSGVQVAPTEIEQTILEYCSPSSVQDVCVAGVPMHLASKERTVSGHSSKPLLVQDELVPRAWVVLRPRRKDERRSEEEREEAVRSEIDAIVRHHLSRPKWLSGGIEFVEQIPKNSTGKVLRRVLQDMYRARQELGTELAKL